MTMANQLGERIKEAFDFASDTTKQLITLSTGVIALTITFAHDIVGYVGLGPRVVLVVAWFIYLLSIVCGAWTLLALTGTLEPTEGIDQAPAASIRASNIVIPSMGQVITFLVATLLTIVFGVWV